MYIVYCMLWLFIDITNTLTFSPEARCCGFLKKDHLHWLNKYRCVWGPTQSEIRTRYPTDTRAERGYGWYCRGYNILSLFQLQLQLEYSSNTKREKQPSVLFSAFRSQPSVIKVKCFENFTTTKVESFLKVFPHRHFASLCGHGWSKAANSITDDVAGCCCCCCCCYGWRTLDSSKLTVSSGQRVHVKTEHIRRSQCHFCRCSLADLISVSEPSKTCAVELHKLICFMTYYSAHVALQNDPWCRHN